MNVAEMSDRKKSVMLARLCGWELVRREWKGALKIAWYNGDEQLTPPQTIDIALWGEDLEAMTCPDLYDPQNMALAWKCIEWVTSPPKTLQMAEAALYTKFGYWWQGNAMWAETAADAQRAWLDMVLMLATEAGMVTK